MKVRELPPVDQLVERLLDVPAPRRLLVAEARRVLAEMRTGLLAGDAVDPSSAEDRVRRNLAELSQVALQLIGGCLLFARLPPLLAVDFGMGLIWLDHLSKGHREPGVQLPVVLLDLFADCRAEPSLQAALCDPHRQGGQQGRPPRPGRPELGTKRLEVRCWQPS